MTAQEENILTSRALLKKGSAMSALLSNCISDKSIDPDEMIVGDRNALLVNIRISGYGPSYETEIQCPQCDEQWEHEFDISQIMKVKPLGVDPDVPGENIFSFVLPVSKRRCTFRLLTGRDDRELTQIQEKMKKTLGPGAPEPGVTLRLQQHLVSIDGDSDRSHIHRLVETMIAGDARALRKHIDTMSPGLDLVQSIECPSCGESSEVDMPIGAEFFWPDIGK
jgi:hypothetical protein